MDSLLIQVLATLIGSGLGAGIVTSWMRNRAETRAWVRDQELQSYKRQLQSSLALDQLYLAHRSRRMESITLATEELHKTHEEYVPMFLWIPPYQMPQAEALLVANEELSNLLGQMHTSPDGDQKAATARRRLHLAMNDLEETIRKRYGVVPAWPWVDTVKRWVLRR